MSTICNSCGPAYGLRGTFSLTLDDFDRALEAAGDVLVPVAQ